MRCGLSSLSLLALSAALVTPAYAQQQDDEAAPAPASTQSSKTIVYDAAFFAPSAPQTALDIARLVPGFNLDLGDVEVRGFAQAAGVAEAAAR